MLPRHALVRRLPDAARGATDLLLASDDIEAGADLALAAGGRIDIEGRISNPSQTFARGETLGGDFVPTSRASSWLMRPRASTAWINDTPRST